MPGKDKNLAIIEKNKLKPKTRYRLTKEDKINIQKLHKNGFNPSQIGEELGINSATVQNYIVKKLGIRKQIRLTEADKIKINKYIDEEEKNPSHIATFLGKNVQAVRRYIKKHLDIKKNDKLSKEDKEQISILYKNKEMDPAGIAQLLGKNGSTVITHIRRHILNTKVTRKFKRLTKTEKNTIAKLNAQGVDRKDIANAVGKSTETIRLHVAQIKITSTKLAAEDTTLSSEAIKIEKIDTLALENKLTQDEQVKSFAQEEQDILAALKLTESYKDSTFLSPSVLSIEPSPYLEKIGIPGEQNGAIATCDLPKGAVIGVYLGDLMTLETLKNTFNVDSSKKLNLHQFNYLMAGPENQPENIGDKEIVRAPNRSMLDAANKGEISAVYFINHRSLMLITLPKPPGQIKKANLRNMLYGANGYLLYRQQLYSFIDGHVFPLTKEAQDHVTAIFPPIRRKAITAYACDLEILQALGETKNHPISHNVEIYKEDGQIIYRTIKAIAKNEELLTTYGGYFQQTIAQASSNEKPFPLIIDVAHEKPLKHNRKEMAIKIEMEEEKPKQQYTSDFTLLETLKKKNTKKAAQQPDKMKTNVSTMGFLSTTIPTDTEEKKMAEKSAQPMKKVTKCT